MVNRKRMNTILFILAIVLLMISIVFNPYLFSMPIVFK